MTRLAALPFAVLALLALGGCGNTKSDLLQGWVEADLIFVSPDEQGRVERLLVREGDHADPDRSAHVVPQEVQEPDRSYEREGNRQQQDDDYDVAIALERPHSRPLRAVSRW